MCKFARQEPRANGSDSPHAPVNDSTHQRAIRTRPTSFLWGHMGWVSAGTAIWTGPSPLRNANVRDLLTAIRSYLKLERQGYGWFFVFHRSRHCVVARRWRVSGLAIVAGGLVDARCSTT